MNQNEIDIFLNEVSAIRKTTDAIKKRYQCFTLLADVNVHTINGG